MNPFTEQITIRKPDLNKYQLDRSWKGSLLPGKLVPIMWEEVIPGDSFRVNTEILTRVAPMVAPPYCRVNIYTHSFFVPIRIIYSEYEKFFTGGEQGTDSPVHPQIDLFNMSPTLFRNGELTDYLGLPTTGLAPGIGINEQISALPFRAYLEIYNEYYRDQNLIPKITYNKGSGILASNDPDVPKLLTLRNRAWKKDYFTSALPNAQRGPKIGAPITDFEYKSVGTVVDAAGNTIGGNGLLGISTNEASALKINKQSLTDIGNPGNIENLASANLLISELRKANALQIFTEAMNRSGSRYVEAILKLFGVQVPDFRAARPEYLGGGKTPVVISEVLSTFQNDVTPSAPQGNMSGHGIAVGSEHGFSGTFTEHGIVMTILSVMPEADYYQGLERKWSRKSRFDYFWKPFEGLGDQEVKNKELYLDFELLSDPNGTFGYQPRYSEYKFGLSTIHGQFRDTLDFWTWARKFTTAPVLNQSFIECKPDHSIFAVSDPNQHPFYVNVYHDFSALRPIGYDLIGGLT